MQQLHFAGIPVPSVPKDVEIELAKEAMVLLYERQMIELRKQTIAQTQFHSDDVWRALQANLSRSEQQKNINFTMLSSVPCFNVDPKFINTSGKGLKLIVKEHTQTGTLKVPGFHPCTKELVPDLFDTLCEILKDVDTEEDDDSFQPSEISFTSHVSYYIDDSFFVDLAERYVKHQVDQQVLFSKVEQYLRLLGARKVERRGGFVEVSKPIREKVRNQFNVWEFSIVELAKAFKLI